MSQPRSRHLARPADGQTDSFLKKLGPGLITGAADDDPSGIGTYSQAGASFGYGMLWLMLWSWPLAVAIQLACARIGSATGHGVGSNIIRHYPAKVAYLLVGLLLVANTVNIGADLGAMALSLQLLLHGNKLWYLLLLGLGSMLAQIFIPYQRYAHYLRWCTLALFSYVGVAFLVHTPWPEVARSLLWPHMTWNGDAVTMIVAVLGTTISPYMFFWQASEEIEVEKLPDSPAEPVHRAAEPQRQLDRIFTDTTVGMGFSNLIAAFIMMATAATLHLGGNTTIESATQAALALKPLAGEAAFLLFTLGIVGTGLLAVPVLAGSSAYALGETMGWPVGLSRKPARARRFYLVIALSCLAGVLLNFTPVNPIRALYWTAIINGVISVPLLIAILLLAARPQVMRGFAIPAWLKGLGWFTVLVMALCLLYLPVSWWQGTAGG
jgi:NRAMP (natural resistance-associated macrophage protein)-like metal ion transporter